MADIVQGFFGGAKSSASSAIVSDADFADFATAASPSHPSHAVSSEFSAATSTGVASPFSPLAAMPGRPYTKWYRVWERVTIEDFYQEMFILPILVVIVLLNMWGASANRRRAKQWAAAHVPLLQSEFAVVGFGGGKQRPTVDDVQGQGLAKAMASSNVVPEEMWKEKTRNEFVTYCTGRQNVASLDIKLTLYKRYNPFWLFGETILSFFFDSIPAPSEKMEAEATCFDGNEKHLAPMVAQGLVSGVKDSSYDNFVFAVVHKDKMKELRDERYDLSLTTTKDNPKLPIWATVMTESAEITDTLLTPELIKAINETGENLESLIITDQPVDAPKRLNDTVPNKRILLSVRINSAASSTSLFTYFLRLPDNLVNTAHFRAEATRKIHATREEEKRKIRKVDEEEKAEERRLASDKLKKEGRDRKLESLSADEQKKFLEKEKEKQQRKMNKKNTVRG